MMRTEIAIQQRPSPLSFLPLPTRLDRLADAELQQGHHLAAERLAERAAELRAEAVS